MKKKMKFSFWMLHEIRFYCFNGLSCVISSSPPQKQLTQHTAWKQTYETLVSASLYLLAQFKRIHPRARPLLLPSRKFARSIFESRIDNNFYYLLAALTHSFSAAALVCAG